MAKRNVISTVVISGLAAFALAACASNARAETFPIKVAQTSEQIEETMRARWKIEVHSGAGIPGSPGASQYIANYLEVLQGIVDRCKLGQTVLVQATDGVSLLAILNTKLTDAQIACVREAARPGLRLVDWGANG